MGVTAWVAFGAVAGIIAEKRGGSRSGLVTAILIGVLGALGGGFLAAVLFDVNSVNTYFSVSTWLAAVVGAALFLHARRDMKKARIVLDRGK